MIVTPLIIPFLIWGAVALAGVFTVAGLAGFWDNPEKNKLGILGMQQAGKTRFLRFLQNKPFIEGSTGRDSYEQFEYKLSNGKVVTVMPGKDIGGGVLYWGGYNDIIDNTDLIIFFFDIDRYLRNELDSDKILYQRSCNGRFEHIFSKTKNSNKPVIVIATHKDKCSFPESVMKRKFDELIQKENKAYKEILKDIQYVDLTNKIEIQNISNLIFNNK